MGEGECQRGGILEGEDRNGKIRANKKRHLEHVAAVLVSQRMEHALSTVSPTRALTYTHT